ncbi:MAG: molybdopterin-dependent oxidoreductase, partial [Pseudomonadota bacterium]
GDVALFNGLLLEIAQRDALNQSYVEAHTQGFSDAVEAARQNVDVAGQTGLAAADLQRFYDLWINTDRVVTVYSQGVNQSEIGTDKVNAIINCHLATGRIGRPGMGPFSVTGQPNAMGGREVGGLANMLANHLSLENADHRDLVRDYWDAPTIATKPGLKAVDLFQACQDGRIKALWIMSTNPVVSMPDADAVRSALETCPFVVVSDIFGDTDTAALADVVFPATAWGEKSGTVTNSERRISRQRPFLPAPGDARPDWQIISDVAGHMGWGAAFDFQEPRQIFNEYAGLSERAVAHGVDLDLTGLMDLSGPAYDALAPVQWPVHRMTDDNVIQRQFANRRFFADGGFFTDTGRARFVPVQNRRIERPQDREDGLILNTGRVRDQWHTMTRTARAPALNRHYAEPFAEIHPRDADRLRVSPADLVIVRTNRGQIIVRALVTDRTQEGTIFVPMHWTAQFASAGRVGTLISPKTDPVSGQPALKMSVAAVERFEAGWYGFVVANRALSLDCAYWAKAPIENGWRAEMAGLDIPEDWEAYARTVLDCAVEEIVSVVDAAGSARIAAISNGIIVGAFFVAPRPVEVSRSHVLDLMGTASDPAQLIAGRPGGSSIDPGPIVCACMNVGANTILHAIQTQGLSSVAAIGEAVQAGTSCGSCKPEVQALLAASSPPVAAE